jgi:hypothetical protein
LNAGIALLTRSDETCSGPARYALRLCRH